MVRHCHFHWTEKDILPLFIQIILPRKQIYFLQVFQGREYLYIFIMIHLPSF